MHPPVVERQVQSMCRQSMRERTGEEKKRMSNDSLAMRTSTKAFSLRFSESETAPPHMLLASVTLAIDLHTCTATEGLGPASENLRIP